MRLYRWILVASTAASVIVAPAGPALAHVSISPDDTATGQFATYTLTVPNERTDQDTIALDVTLPAGFELETAESLPGWQTVVDTRPDGTATAVHWRLGRIPPHAFGRFALRGRTGDQQGTLSFAAVQRYDRDTDSWTGGAGSEYPAPTLTVRSTPPSAEGSSPGAVPPQVPAATTARTSDVTSDPLARSRAGLALALALAALLLVAGTVGGMVLRRRSPGSGEHTPTPSSGPQTAGPSPARSTANKRPSGGLAVSGVGPARRERKQR
jgi:uncharacterized protein YcnI